MLGCSNCYVEQQKLDVKSANRRWWSAFIPSFRLGASQPGSKALDYSKVHNANFAVKTSVECESAGIIVSSSNIEKENEPLPHLSLKLIKRRDGFSFISDSWDRLNREQINVDEEYSIRTIEVLPKPRTNPDQERFLYIDHESYEVKPIRITLLPKLINIYSP